MTTENAVLQSRRPFSFKRIGAAILVAGGLFSVSACTDADVVSSNLSKAADNFEVQRRIVFYNGITGDYILEVEGLCAIGNNDTAGRLSVTCKVGAGNDDSAYKKHFLGLSDNVTFFAEQLAPVKADPYRYRVTFKPEVIIPDIDTRTSGKQGGSK